MSATRNRTALRGFSTVELLVVIAVIAMLTGLLFPALVRSRSAALKARSMSHLRQINIWMNLYSDNHNGTVLPSQFDYRADSYKGHVRTVPDYQAGMTLSQGEPHEGTWADILWTENGLGLTTEFAAARAAGVAGGYSYVYDSPDDELYKLAGDGFENILRSAAVNTRNTPDPQFAALQARGTDAKPYGTGAKEIGQPGYFAANDWFNARLDSLCGLQTNQCLWVANAQMRVPDRTMYLVDSVAGEIIDPAPYAFYNVDPRRRTVDDPTAPISVRPLTNEVDFRYSGACLMLMLDGHLETVGPWDELVNLQKEKRINITNPLSSTP